MSDSYEIGITLALENGVSDGIAVIERDLSTLDQAIAQSVSGLTQLREVASGVLATAEADVRRAAGLAAALPTRPAAAVAEPAVATAGPASAERTTPARSADAPVVAGSGPLQEAVAPASSTAAPQLPARDAVAAMAPPQAPVIALHNGAVAPAIESGPTVTDSPRQDSTTTPAAPSPAQLVLAPALQADVPMLPPASAAPARDGGVGAPTREVGEPRAVAQPVPQAPDLAALGRSVLAPTLQADDATPAGESAPAETPMQSAAVAQSGAGRDDQEAADVHADGRAARPAAAASREARPRSAEPVAAPGTPYASAAPAQSTGGMMQISGDVTLDGQVMGRWMSDRMARDAGRPPSGPTGFDASRSPAWPGATVS